MKRWALVFVVVLLSGCLQAVRGPGSLKQYEDVALNSSDGFLIAADYYPSDSDDGLILLHMMGKTKSSYRDIAPLLMDEYKVLAIDFRGHGDSDGDFTLMVDADFKKFTLDIDAAAKALKAQGVTSISIVGASVGANAAVLYAENHDIDKLVLLAPGNTYRGLDISRTVVEMPMFIMVGHYDAYSSTSIDALESNWPKGRVMEYDTSAHGTDLFTYDLSAREDLLFYLS